MQNEVIRIMEVLHEATIETSDQLFYSYLVQCGGYQNHGLRMRGWVW